jgi:hypothetical protein
MTHRKDDQEEATGMEAAERNAEELPERWSARAKTEIVLRLLKGEDLRTVSRRSRCRWTSSSGGDEARGAQVAQHGLDVGITLEDQGWGRGENTRLVPHSVASRPHQPKGSRGC